MDERVIVDKISGTEAGFAFAKVNLEQYEGCQTTRINVGVLLKVMTIAQQMGIVELFITVKDDKPTLFRKLKDSDIAIVVSQFASLNSIP